MTWLFEPGWWSTPSVRTALLAGALVAAASAVVGVFTVIRGQSFAGHALTDVAVAGGSGAAYAGAPQLAGYLAATVLGAGAMEAIGEDRVRQRDVATGVVLGAATALAALFLYLTSTSSAVTGTTQTVLFGSLFFVPSSYLVLIAVASAAVVAIVAAIWRPLLIGSLAPELARSRGVRTGLVGAVFLATMAVAVGLSSVVVGSILSTALLIGPAASALRARASWSVTLGLSVVLGVVAAWLGVLLSYDSYDWIPSHRSVPVSACVVAVVVVEYALASLALGRGSRGRAS
ncbi:MAG TPA: metal ABC transporter permease [Acidimicrobiales bacterium]|nr:metal ABC transporter permease [Acidimicrobiales bacterium]